MQLAHNFLSTDLCTAIWGLWTGAGVVVIAVSKHIPLCLGLR